MSSHEIVESLATFNIFVPLSIPFHSEVIIAATETNNGTRVQCLVEEEGDIRILNRSNVVTLLVVGE